LDFQVLEIPVRKQQVPSNRPPLVHTS